MKRSVALTLGGAVVCLQAMAGCSREAGKTAQAELAAHGGGLFALYCAGCHPDGANLLYPQKTLHRIDLAANGITTPAGIVAKMRNPDRGMRQFDKTAISDKDAHAIAQYILVTF
jgi:mono/diheme cytochrome c family protein